MQSVTFEVTDLSGQMDLGIEVFGSYGYSTYWAGRADGIWQDQSGAGGTERMTISFYADDWFGFLVWNNGNTGGAYRIRLIDPAVSDVAEADDAKFDLRTVGPNPFHETAGLQYSIATGGMTHLAIYDLQGRLVRALVDGERNAGAVGIMWDGRDDAGTPVSSGVYFARLESGTLEKTVKLVRSQ